MEPSSTTCLAGLPGAHYPPEVRVLMGVHLLQMKLESLIESVDLDPSLPHQERHMLGCLDAPKRMGVLAQEMLALPSTATAAADGLVAKGFVRRERDPTDRRAWLLHLTDEGQIARAALLDRAGAILREATGLPTEKIEILADLLDRVRDTILQTGIPEDMKE